MTTFDDLMAIHVRRILEKDEPSPSELELVRKYLNDKTKREAESLFNQVDPLATAAQTYGIQFDRPINVEDLGGEDQQ